MASLVRGVTVDCANPALDIWLQVAGQLTNPVLLQYQVFSLIDGVLASVLPIQTLDTSACLDGGARVTTGHFCAEGFQADPNATPGRYRIRWTYQMTDAAPVLTFSQDFDLLEQDIDTPSDGYCLISDLRAEGMTDPQAYSDMRLQELINKWSRYVEKVTGRFFLPRFTTMRLDGSGARLMRVEQPIIGMDTLTVAEPGTFAQDVDLASTDYVIYNRALTQGMSQPDDRNDPRIEFAVIFGNVAQLGSVWGSRWPSGQQNIKIKALFGYTDPDRLNGTNTMGRTPPALVHATKLLVKRDLPLLSDEDSREDALYRVLLQSESVDGQSYSRALPASGGRMGCYTGDPEIDGVLAAYRKRTWLASSHGSALAR